MPTRGSHAVKPTVRILLSAAVVVFIALMVCSGLIDYPMEATQLFSYDKLNAFLPEQTNAAAAVPNWNLPDQLKLKLSSDYTITISVIDQRTDPLSFLIYHKTGMLIAVSVQTRNAIVSPALGIVILDPDGLIRGYRLVDLSYFADIRRPIYGPNQVGFPPPLNVIVNFIFATPSDMRSVKIWTLLYSAASTTPVYVNPIYGTASTITQTIVFGSIVTQNYLLATQDIDYTYATLQDIQWNIILRFGPVVTGFGVAYELFLVRRIPSKNKLFPYLIYVFICMILLVGVLWFPFR